MSRGLYLCCLWLCACRPEWSSPLSCDNLRQHWVLSAYANPASSSFSVLTFQGDSARFVPGDGWTSCHIRGDTLILGSLASPDAVLPIETVSDDSIRFGPPGDTTSFTLLNLRLLRDTTLSIERIAIHGGECLGTCPRFSLEIDSTGQMRYEGRKYAPLQGQHFKRDNTGAWQRLAELAQALPLDSLPEPRSMPDLWALRLEVVYNGQQRDFSGGRYLMGPVSVLVEEMLDLATVEFWHKRASSGSEGS